MSLVRNYQKLATALTKIDYSPPVFHVYNPAGYAQEPHDQYLRTYAEGAKEVIFLGMNPGPYGMTQTGVPFGDPHYVQTFLGIDGHVRRPRQQHPKRPILGFDSPRSEVSGQRLWGWIAEHFGTPEAFFERFVILNYCPLVFLEESGRNLTPDKLNADERRQLQQLCDAALVTAVEQLEAKWVVGVGQWAQKQAKRALTHLGDAAPQLATVLHPSPASPIANRGWAAQAEDQLASLGLL